MTVSRRILVVDDKATIHQFITDLFRIWSVLDHCEYVIDSAFNGIEGLQYIQTYRPDLILLDIHMPKMMGDKMLKTLRATGDTTPVIIIAGREYLTREVLALLTKRDACILKPIASAALYAQVKKQLHCQQLVLQ